MSTPLFIGCRYPDTRAASLVHTMSGPEREEPGQWISHILRPWPLFVRAFSSRRRAYRWPLGACGAQDDAAMPSLFLPQDRRIVRAGLAKGARLFDLAVASDCILFLRSVADDSSLQGFFVEAVRRAGPLPGRTSVTSSIASSSPAPSPPTTTSKCINARRSLLNAASRQPALLHRRRMKQASPAAGALPEPVPWSNVSPAKRAKLATAPGTPLSLLSTKTGSLMS